ncbi:YlmH family RNA-binding protein [Lentilactobacillus parafarraginis]|uniref:YlmH family RNA-binding protein n=1 Tax=Lentilactobacillus parafarraginis TaxID=390842 RepID=UPI0002DB8B0C|nr:YlmH/Sll1252 family protein [Lentilactobacillus parafarraginis]
MVDSTISQHFRPDEVPFLESIDNLSGQVENEYRPILTGFLNPRQLFILESIINRHDGIRFSTFGGYEGAELKRAIVYPEYFTPKNEDFHITSFVIDYPSKFATLSHGQVLGSIMGAGIERDVIGDIITDGLSWQFLCQSEMADYIKAQVDKVGKIKVKLEVIESDQLVTPVDESEEVSTTISSLRVDALVSEGFHISRHHAKELIDGGEVRINWGETQRPDLEVSMHDIVSVRGYGRIVIREIDGITKKGKIRLVVRVYNRNK